MASHVFHQLYYHFVWATKDRHPLIVDEVRDWLVECVSAEAGKRDGHVVACNAMPDHVHLFVSLPPTVAPAIFIGKVKGASSHHFNDEFAHRHFLAWPEGYGVVTVRKGESARVAEYVANQQEIHANRKASRTLETMSIE